MPRSAGFVTGDPAGPAFTWPQGMYAPVDPAEPANVCDLGLFAGTPGRNLVNSFVVNQDADWGYFTAFNPKYSLLIGYLFPAREFPWLNVWQHHDNQIIARGMEFSNTPHHGTMKTLVSKAEMWGIPTYEWLNARSTLTKRFIAVCFPLAGPLEGTASVGLRGETFLITEKRTDRIIQIPI